MDQVQPYKPNVQMPYYHHHHHHAPVYTQPVAVHGVAAPVAPMGFATTTGVILVLFILLVIILRSSLAI